MMNLRTGLRIISISTILISSLLCGISGNDINYMMVGDVNLGGLFPLHTYNETAASCGTIRSLSSIKRVEAMVYAIGRVNEDPTILPDITVGFEIYDTCSHDATTLHRCLNFIPPIRETPNVPNCTTADEAAGARQPGNRSPIVGVVGAQRSSSSLQAALLLSRYHIPQVSYLSTSDELSNDRRYPYFLRTVGPDRFQVRAMIDILLHFNWSYVSFIHSDDTYGNSAEQMFTTLASNYSICVGLTRKVSSFDSEDKYDSIITELLDIQRLGTHHAHATVVVLFVHLEMAQSIFSASTRLKGARRFIWIGSDSWGNYGEEATSGNEEAALGKAKRQHISQALP